MYPKDECNETGNLREPSSGMASGIGFLRTTYPAENSSGNDRIMVIKDKVISIDETSAKTS